nr:hypothetical protein [Paraburkholderia sp. BL8N3]
MTTAAGDRVEIEPNEATVQLGQRTGAPDKEADNVAKLDLVAEKMHEHRNRGVEERCAQQRLQDDGAKWGVIEGANFVPLEELAEEETGKYDEEKKYGGKRYVHAPDPATRTSLGT